MFRCFVVRHNNQDRRNFIPLLTVPSDLKIEATWKRDNVKEFHFLADRVAGVAKSAKELIEFMKHPGFTGRESNVLTHSVERRANG